MNILEALLLLVLLIVIIALGVALADVDLEVGDVPGVRGWASPEASVAELHRTEGHTVAELTVPVRTLASICARSRSGAGA